MGGAGLQGLGSVDGGQVDDGVAVLVGDPTGLAAGGEGHAALGLDVELGVQNGLLEQLRVLQSRIGLHGLLVVGNGNGIGGAAGGGDLHANAGSAGDNLLGGERLIAVQGLLHGTDNGVVGILRSHPGDQTAQALLADVGTLGGHGPLIIAGEEVTGGGAVVVACLGGLIVILLQVVLRNNGLEVAAAIGAAGGAVGNLYAVGRCGGQKARALGIGAVIFDAGPAAGVGSHADDDLGVVDLIAVGFFQILHAGVHGEGRVDLGFLIIVGVGVQSGLVAGIAVPGTVQVVGHHVGKVHDVQNLIVLNLGHEGGVGGHGAGQLVILAVGLAQGIQLVPDGLHHQREVDGIGLGALAALVHGNAVAGGIGIAVSGGVLPVDVYKIKAQVIYKLGNVLGKGGPGSGAGGHLREVAGTGPAAHGNADLHVGVFVPQQNHSAQNAGVGIAICKAALLGKDGLEVGVLVAEDQVAAGIHVHKSKVQMGDLAAVNIAGVILMLASVDGPLAVIDDVAVPGSLSSGGRAGRCVDADGK